MAGNDMLTEALGCSGGAPGRASGFGHENHNDGPTDGRILQGGVGYDT